MNRYEILSPSEPMRVKWAVWDTFGIRRTSYYPTYDAAFLAAKLLNALDA
jgi:hypothetical protein